MRVIYEIYNNVLSILINAKTYTRFKKYYKNSDKFYDELILNERQTNQKIQEKAK